MTKEEITNNHGCASWISESISSGDLVDEKQDRAGSIFVMHTFALEMDIVETFINILSDPDVIQDLYRLKRASTRKKNGHFIQVKEELFPGYVFVEVSPCVPVSEVLEQVEKVRTYSSHYARLLDNQMGLEKKTRTWTSDFLTLTGEEAFFIRGLCGGTDHTAGISTLIIDEEHPFRKGEIFRVVDGPLKDLETDIVKVDLHKRRAWINSPLFGGESDIMLSFNLLKSTEELQNTCRKP